MSEATEGMAEAEADADRLERRLDRVLTGLRSFGADYAEFTRRFAASLGLHTTDAAALVEILYAEDRGTPLSPARLAERIGLSSGATTALLNRLETAGYMAWGIVTLFSHPPFRLPACEPPAVRHGNNYYPQV